MQNPLIAGLEAIQSGTKELVSPDREDESYEAFQAMAEALIEAKEAQLLYQLAEQRSMSRETYGHVVRIITMGGLTPKGRDFLRALHEPLTSGITTESTAPTTSSAPDKEIFRLTPTFAGMSVDLKALWRKWATWYEARKSQ